MGAFLKESLIDVKSLTVENLVQIFSLNVLTGENQLHKLITQPRSHRPGLEFVGHFDFFPTERVQILGRKEITYLHKLSIKERKLRIGNIVKYRPPCFIVTAGQEGLTYLTQYCIEEEIPLLCTNELQSTSEFILKLDNYMVKTLAPETAIHGVCLNVYGMGILIRGKSGVGKSETAHTLIGRGHRLVADDIVVLKKLSPRTILGTHDVKTKEFLSLRSIGLLNVVRLYGRKAFQDETRIALDIELTTWQKDTLNNELEHESKFTEYMGVQIPHIEIQLQPGRDVAGLIEAAANNWLLKQQGYSAAEEFMKRLDAEF
jgi:HPr kinase/phosphorylase